MPKLERAKRGGSQTTVHPGRTKDPDMILNQATPHGPNPVAPKADEPLVACRVCHGRSVHAKCEGEPIWVGAVRVERNGELVMRDIFTSPQRAYQAGETIELPESEVNRLVELGYVTLDETSLMPKPGPMLPQSPTDEPVITPENDPRRQAFAKRAPKTQRGTAQSRTTTSP